MNNTQFTKYWHDLPWTAIKLKANTHLPKFVLVLLILLLTKTVADLTWTLLSPAESPDPANSSQPAIGKNQSGTANSANGGLNAVSQYHLFGEANKKAPVATQKIIDAPETRLRLTLKGVFASTDPATALGIISASTGQDKKYHIGDKVTGGAILHAVYTDRVILKRDGRLETLRLPKPKMDDNAINQTENQPNPVSHLGNVPAARKPTKPTKPQSLKILRENLLNDPAKVWKQVRINPIMDDGKIKGYTLAHNNVALMKSMNLRKTDIITEVNGESLSDPSTLYGLMNNLKQQQSLQLTVERNGQIQFIELNF